VCLWLLLICSS